MFVQHRVLFALSLKAHSMKGLYIKELEELEYPVAGLPATDGRGVYSVNI